MDTHADRTRPFSMTWALFWILVGMGVLAVALGFVGFRLDFPEDSVELSIYKSVQLLTLESGDSGKPASWPLAVARWLAPISLLGGAIQFLRSLYHRMRLQHRAGFSSDHVLVMGLGHTGTAFVRAHLGARTGRRVLGIEIDPGLAVQELARDPRFLLVPGDARDPAVRKAASMARAQEIVIATDVDERNLELAEACKQELERAGRKGCTIRVHLTDVALRDALQRSASAPGGGHALFDGNKDVRVLLVNHFVDQARKLVFLNPLEMVCGRNGATDPSASIHLVLTGLDRLQTAVLLEVARVGHYSHGRKVHVHLVGDGAAGALDRIRASYPRLERCLAGLSVVECPRGAGYVWHVASVVQRLPAEALVTVLPSTLGGEELHADVFRLREQVPGRAVQVLLPRSGHQAGEAAWVRQLHGAQGGIVLGGCVREFEVDAILAECVVDAADGKDDRLGERIHDAWLRKQYKEITNLQEEAEQAKASGDAARASQLLAKAAAQQGKATYRAWQALTEAQREANYAQASHYAIKVRAAGLDSKTLTKASWAAIDVECLARMEHERWMAMQWYAGWEHGVTRDDAARRHPDLVPYDQLSEGVKGYDRDAVRNVIDLLPDLVDELRKTERR